MRSIVFSIIYLLPIYAFVVHDHASSNIHSKSNLLARWGSPPPESSSSGRRRPVAIYGDPYEPVLYPGAQRPVTYGQHDYPQPSYPRLDSTPNYNGRAPPRGSSGRSRDDRGDYNTYLSDPYASSHATGYGDLQQSYAPQQALGSHGSPLTFASPRPPAQSTSRRQQSLDAYTREVTHMSNYDQASPWDHLDDAVYNTAPDEAAYMNTLRAPGEDPVNEEDISPINTHFYDNRSPSPEPPRRRPNARPRERPRAIIMPDERVAEVGRGGRPRVVEVRRPRDRDRRQRRSSYYVANDRKAKRATIIDSIMGDTTGTAPQSQTAQAQFQIYKAAYASVQSNISEAIFPYLDEILAGTNSSLAYNMALSIWAELTAAPFFVATPFSYGQNCLDWIEEAWINQTNSNATAAHGANGSMLYANGTYANGTYNFALLEFQATSRVLLELYEYAWYNASAAANRTGLLKELATLSGYLLPVNASIQTPGFSDPHNSTMENLSYFTVYNETMNDNTTIPGLGY